MQQHTNIKFFGKNLLFLFLLIFSGFNSYGQRINVPGTGRGIAIGANEQRWQVSGVWTTHDDPNTGNPMIFGGDLNRIGTGTLCLSNDDHEIRLTPDINEQDPQHGSATVYIYYQFQVTYAGNYYADFYAKTSSPTSIQLDLVKKTGSGDDIKAATNIIHADCDPYHLGAYLDPGTYQIRFETSVTAHTSPFDLFVSSNDGDIGNCVPTPQMSSTSNVTITSGETASITFNSTILPATYTWSTAGNPNTSVTASGPNTGTGLTQTITNSTSTAQTVTYTVTPTASVGTCAGVSQLVTITINPTNCPTANFSYRYDDCPNEKANIRFECTSSGVGPSDACTWNFGDGTTENNSIMSPVFHQYTTEGTYNVTMTLHHAGCPNSSVTKTVTFYNPVIAFSASGTTLTSGHTVRFTFSAGYPPNNTPALTTTLDLGNGTVISNPVSPYDWVTSGNGTYNVTFKATDPTSGIICVIEKTIVIKVVNCNGDCDVIECKNCIGSFAPDPGQEYTISAWVLQSDQEQEVKYTGPSIALDFTNGNGALNPTFITSGIIIDGWQRIDGTFTVPPTATEVFVKLINSSSNDVYFDDLRIHPLKASLKSFVYDPVSMRLMAELDENNYATFYEYDEEGALIRVKKETERGVKTIKETGNNIRKKP